MLTFLILTLYKQKPKKFRSTTETNKTLVTKPTICLHGNQKRTTPAKSETTLTTNCK